MSLHRQWLERRRRVSGAAARAETALRLLRRFDLVLIAVFAGLAAVAAGAGYGEAMLRRAGLIGTETAAEPVPDHRILTNIRKDAKPYVDAAIAPGEGALYAAKEPATIHRLNLATMLWSDETLQPLSAEITSPIALLQSACGRSLGVEGCADTDTVFAVSRDGGVAMRRDGRWTTLIADNRFEGIDGKPVRHEDMLAAAIMPDGRRLAIGTAGQGIGLFDLDRRSWIRLEPALQASILGNGPTPRITQLVTVQNRLLIGTEKGLAWLQQNRDAFTAGRIDGLDGPVLSIAGQGGGTAMVLARRTCPSGSDECTGIMQVGPDGNVLLLAGEIERNPALDEAAIIHAQPVGNEVLALGPRGVFTYSPALRRWTIKDKREVTALWQGGGQLVYAHPGAVIRIARDGTAKEWPMEAQDRLDHIAPAADGTPLLLSRSSGRIFALATDRPHLIADNSAAAGDLDRMMAAVEIDNLILLVGPAGGVLHDPVARTYQSIATGDMPRELLSSNVRLLVGSNTIWAVATDEGWVSAVTLDRANVTLKSLGRTQTGRILNVSPAGRGLLLTTVDRVANYARIDNQAIVVDQLGTSLPRDIGPLRGASALNAEATVADARGVFSYDMTRRAWSEVADAAIDGEPIADFASSGGQLFVLGGAGSVKPAGKQPRLFGTDRPIPIGRSELTDAWAMNDTLALAARGRIALYNMAERQLGESWDLPGGPLRLAGMIGQVPIAYDGASAWAGRNSLLLPGAQQVLGAAVSGSNILTTQRDARGFVFAAEFSPGSTTPTCLFREPDGGGSRALDARAIGNGLAVLTPEGLQIYDEAQRRWVRTGMAAPPSGARLARLDRHLAIHNDRGAILVALGNDATLGLPSCATGTINPAQQRIDGRQIAVDETTGRIAALKNDGSLDIWSGARADSILPAANEGPDPAMLRRMARLGPTLHFAARDGLWSYDIATRRWQRRAIDGAQSAADLGLTASAGGLALTLRDSSGRDTGVWLPERGTPDKAIALSGGPQPGAAPFDPADLIDVAQITPSRWAFLSRTRLSLFDAAAGSWRASVDLGSAVTNRRLVRYGAQLALIEGPADAPSRLAFPTAAMLDAAGGVLAFDQAMASLVPAPGETVAIAQRPARAEAIRLAAAGDVTACRLDVPGPVANCRTQLPRPIAIDLNALRAAWGWTTSTLVVDDKGARLIDRAARTEIALPALAGLDPQARAVTRDGVLWLREPSGRVLTVDRAGATAVQSARVDDLFNTGRGAWAVEGNIARPIVDGSLQPPAEVLEEVLDGHKLQSLNVGRDGSLDVLADDGTLIAIDVRGNALRDDLLRLPGAPPSRPITMAMAGTFVPPGGLALAGWWLQAGDRLDFVAAEACKPGPLCARAIVGYDLPAGIGPMREIRSIPILEVDIGGVVYRPATDGKSLQPTQEAAAPHVAIGTPIPESRADLARDVDGAGRLDPVALRPTPDGFELIQGRIRTERMSGALVPVATDPLQAGWLRWDRDQRLFVLRDFAGTEITATADRLLPGGRFASTVSGRALLIDRDRYVQANPHGLWRWPRGGDWTNGPAWQPLSLPDVVQATAGRFYFAAGSIAADGRGRIEADGDTGIETEGALRLEERIRGGQITARIGTGGQTLDAFADRGFLHDRRLGTALDRDGAWLLTPVGLVRPDGLAGILPLPAGRPDDLRATTAAGRMLLRQGVGYLDRQGSGWVPVADPTRDWSIHQGNAWQWRGADGAVVVEGAAWRIARKASLRFDADSLQGITYAADGGILAVTAAGTHAAATFEALAGQAPTAAGPGDGILETRFLAPGKPVAGVIGGGRLRAVWDGLRNGWTAPAADANPDERRRAVTSALLTIDFTRNDPAVAAMARHPTRGPTAIPITWDRGQPLPFDRVTAIAADDRHLYLGTPVGMFVVVGGTNPRLAPLVDTRPQAAGPPAAVQRIGRPAGDLARMAARGSDFCLDLAGKAPSFCRDPAVLDRIALGGNSFWQWTADPTPQLRYLDGQGQPIGAALRTIDHLGLPHDRLSAIVMCGQGPTVTLWGDGIVTDEAGLNAGLSSRSRSTNLSASRVNALYCLPRDTETEAGTLAGGIYALAPARTALRVDGTAWQPLVPPLAAEAIARGRGAIIYDRRRLRLVDRGLLEGGTRRGPSLEYRDRSDRWRSVPSRSGRYAIDVDRSHIVAAGGATYLATAGGLVQVRAGTGGFGIDPDKLLITAMPSLRNASCAPDRLETLAAVTVVRCATGELFTGTLDGTADANVFRPRPGPDPFVQRLLFEREGGDLRWSIVDARPGRPGRLEFRWRGETVPLTGGRFATDVVRRFALVDEGYVDMATEAGWLRSPAGDFGLPKAFRAADGPVPAAVRDLAADGGETPDSRLLCLLDRDGTLRLRRPGGELAAGVGCGRLDASDRLWSYLSPLRADPAPLSITATDAAGGRATRGIENGRFRDLIAEGAPVIARVAPGREATLLVPARGSITVIDAANRQQPGWPLAEPADRALLVDRRGVAMMVDAQGLAGLDGSTPLTCPALAQAARQLGPGTLRSIALTLEGRIDLLAIGRDGRMNATVECTSDNPAALPWTAVAAISGRDRFQARRSDWPDAQGDLAIAWRAGTLSASDGGRAGEIMLGAGMGMPLRLLRHHDYIFFLRAADIVRVDIDAALAALHDPARRRGARTSP